MGWSGTPGLPTPPSSVAPTFSLWRAVRRRWMLVAALLVIGVGAAVTFLKMATPRYEAVGSLRLQSGGSSPIAALQEMTGMGGKDEVSTEIEVLRSRSLGAVVVDSLSLRVSVKSPADGLPAATLGVMKVDSAAPTGSYQVQRDGTTYTVTNNDTQESGKGKIGEVSTLFGLTISAPPTLPNTVVFTVRSVTEAIADLRGRVRVARAGRDASLISVRLESANSIAAEAMVGQLMHTYLRSRVQNQKRTSSSSVAFIRRQMDTLSYDLRHVEDSLKRFQELTGIIAPEIQIAGGIAAAQGLNIQISAVRTEREALQRLVNERTNGTARLGEPSPWRDILAFPSIVRNAAAASLLTNLTEADSKVAELLVRRVETDPDAVASQQRVTELETQARRLVQSYIAGLRAQEVATISEAATPSRMIAAAPANQLTYARLTRQNKVLAEAYIMMQGELKKNEIAEAIDDSDAQIVDEASANPNPIFPRTLPVLMLGLLVGLGAGLGLAVVLENRDTTIRSRAQVRNITPLPILGSIPHLNPLSKTKALRTRADALVTLTNPKSAPTEAYRILRTQIQHAPVPMGGSLRLLMFSSPSPGDGKTTTAANIAVTFAMQGKRVLLVDGDLRRGTLNDVVGCVQRPGVTEILKEQIDVMDAIQTVKLENDRVLHVLASGQTSATAAELVSGVAFAELLDRLKTDFDLVILDTPPLNLVTDGALLATKVDGAVVVIRAGKSEQGELAFALDQLQSVRAPLLGVIMNDFNPTSESEYGGYGYGYGSGYGGGAYYGRTEDGDR